MYLATKPPALAISVGAAVVIGADDLAHVLGVEPRRKRGRADEVAEHHRQLAALGGGARGGGRDRGGGWRVIFRERGDRLENLQPRAKRQTKLAQMRIGELAEHVGIDRIVAEGLRISRETDAAEPRLDVQFGPRAFVSGGKPPRTALWKLIVWQHHNRVVCGCLCDPRKAIACRRNKIVAQLNIANKRRPC